METAAGEVLGGYRILAKLGEGGEGAVYLAESTDGLAKRVALKRFGPAAEKSLRRELEAYRRIEEIRRATGTPNLAEGMAAGSLPDGSSYIAVAYQEGGSLADRVTREGPLPWGEAAAIVEQILDGLAHLHAAGLCHRDVKPHNVLVGADGVARIGDFGLSTEQDGSISSGGTPAFGAPEQWGAVEGPSGVAIDVYGAGATLYFLLTGRPPLPGRPDIFLLERRMVPRPLQEAVLRALEAEPRARWPGALELAGALRAARELAGALRAARELAGALRAARGERAAPRGPSAVPLFRVSAILSVLLLGAVAAAAALRWAGRDRDRAPAAPVPAAATGTGAPAAPPLQAIPRVLDGEWRLELALPDGRLVRGTPDGRVLLVDPSRPDEPPREVAAFGHGVLELSFEQGALTARGDDRRPRPLAPGEEPAAGEMIVEGATGRFAFPRDPDLQVRAVPLPPDAGGSPTPPIKE